MPDPDTPPTPVQPSITVTAQKTPPSSRLSSSHYVPELPLPEKLQALIPPGAYVIESFLGHGGTGAVYRGLQMPS
jgi:hypothetical protein